MEKRVLGIILSVLGVAGLIYAGISFVNGGEGTRNIKAIIFTGLLGAISCLPAGRSFLPALD
jgi:hypothetical protein